MQRINGAWAAFMVLTLLQPAKADTFFLRSGGQIEGELLNADQKPRKSYEIAVAGGGQITLQADVIEKVQTVPPELAEYENLRRKTRDTVLDQMNLADWCRQHGLAAQRKTVLEHVLQLDPEQPEVRKMLGYHKVKDQWMTHEEEQIDKGYVKSRNPSTGLIEWVPPQVAENRNSVQRRIKSEAEWRKKIHGYRRADGRPACRPGREGAICHP